MAKKDTQEIQENEVGSVESVVKAPKVVNMVQLADGTSKNFGKSMKLLSDEDVTETGFKVTFHIITGEQVVYESTDTSATEFTRQQAAFGVSAKVKASCAGVAPKELFKVITDKVKDITEGNFASRVTGEATQALSLIQTAYAAVNDIDVSTTEGVAKVNAIFLALSKEEKSALYSNPKIGVKLAQLRLEAAIAAAEKAEEKAA